MKFASILPAKVLILLFIGIAGTSAFYGKKIHQEVPAMTGQLKTAEKTLKDLENDSRTLEEYLAPDSSHITLTGAMSDALLAVMDNRVRYGINVGTIAPHKPATGTVAADFAQLADNIPGSTVPSVRVDIRGTYRGLEGLNSYLAELRKHPVAIAYLKVESNTFELGIRVYGNNT